MSQGEVDVTSIVNVVGAPQKHRPSSLNLSTMTVQSFKSNSDTCKSTSDPPTNTTRTNKNDDADDDDDKITDTRDDTPPAANDGTKKALGKSPEDVNDDNSSLALRIVSPGLPQLSDEMKNTVRLSQQIHLQQKTLIAARNNGDDQDADNGNDDVEDDDKSSKKSEERLLDKIDESLNQPVTTTLVVKPQSDDTLRLNTPTSARGLKRKHVPAPLTIDAAEPMGPIPKPAIHSAPLVSKIKPGNSRKPQTTPKNSVKFPTHLTPHKSSPYQNQNPGPASSKRIRLVHPHTSTSPYFPHSRYYYQQITPQPSSNIYGRFAPTPFYSPQSQSQYYQSFQNYQQYQHQIHQYQQHHQQQLFQQLQEQPQSLMHQPHTPYPGAHLAPPGGFAVNHPLLANFPAKPALNVTAPPANDGKNLSKVVDVYHGDLLKDAPMKSQPLSSQKEIFDKKRTFGDFDDADAEEIDDRMPVSEDELKEMEEKYSKNNEIFNVKNHNEVFGSINLMNQKVYNFKIFGDDHSAQPGASTEPKSQPDKDHDNHDKDHDPSQDSAEGENSNTLAKQREKFLKICEKTWDEFVTNRSQ